MKKRLVLSVVIALLMVAMLPGVASAEGPPVGGCPSGTTNDGPDPEARGWALEPVGPYGGDVGIQVDLNGDGWVCQRFVYGLRLNHPDGWGVWVVKDNTHT